MEDILVDQQQWLIVEPGTNRRVRCMRIGRNTTRKPEVLFGFVLWN